MTNSWNENLKTGISIIDEQHKKIFDTLDNLKKEQRNKACFYDVLMELQTYAAEHFVTEEKYMKYMNYPDFPSHKEAHNKFIKEYKDILKKNVTVGNIMDLQPELVEFVENWLHTHYENEDVHLAIYINKQSLENNS